MNAVAFKSSFKATILVVVSAACFASSIVSPCLPLIAKYFNVESAQTSLFVSFFLFGYLFGQVFYSILSQKIGYKNTLIFGFLIYIFSAIAQVVFIKHYWFDLLLCSRFFCAFGASSGLICVFAIINDYSAVKEETQKLISLAFISLTLFSYLSVTLGGFVTHYFGWIFVFYFLIVASILNLLMIFLYMPSVQKRKHQYEMSLKLIFMEYLKSFLNYRLLCSSLMVAFTTTSTYLYNAIGSTIAIKIFILSPKCFGMYSILNLIGLISGGWISARMIKNYELLNVLVVGVIISSVPIGMFVLLKDVIFNSDSKGLLFFMLIAILNFGLGLIYPIASYFALNSIKCSSTASSIMNFIKIACPALAIYCVSRLHLGLIDSFETPLLIMFLITIICYLIIKFSLFRSAITADMLKIS